MQNNGVMSLEHLLEASSASDAFKQAVAALERGEAQLAIVFNAMSPRVKVLRVICKLLEVLPGHPFERVEIQAMSGCSNFTGQAKILPGGMSVDFNWDCRWRAEQEGWNDAFGDPDQIRAAQTFGYQCFAKFEVCTAG